MLRMNSKLREVRPGEPFKDGNDAGIVIGFYSDLDNLNTVSIECSKVIAEDVVDDLACLINFD